MLEFFDIRDLWAMTKFHEFPEGKPVGIRWFDNKPSVVLQLRDGSLTDAPIPESIVKECRVRIGYRDKLQPTFDDGLPF